MIDETDLIQRCYNACNDIDRLRHEAAARSKEREWDRLGGKLDGIWLVLSYIREMQS